MSILLLIQYQSAFSTDLVKAKERQENLSDVFLEFLKCSFSSNTRIRRYSNVRKTYIYFFSWILLSNPWCYKCTPSTETWQNMTHICFSLQNAFHKTISFSNPIPLCALQRNLSQQVKLEFMEKRNLLSIISCYEVIP